MRNVYISKWLITIKLSQNKAFLVQFFNCRTKVSSVHQGIWTKPSTIWPMNNEILFLIFFVVVFGFIVYKSQTVSSRF